MRYVLCPSCHRGIPADEFLVCDAADTTRFVQCPECNAFIPLPEDALNEVLPELEAA